MTFFDFLKDLNDTAKERLKTPITGAFMFSFLLYNWRPIAVLIFSEATIEDKIIVVNHEYCDIWAILIPIIMAFVYIMGTPKLMVWIDSKMTKTKLDRLKKIYQNKEDEVMLKKNLAGKILELKDVESGNKEKQDFLDQIEALTESNDQRAKADSNTIKELNSSLKDSNELVQNLSNRIESNNVLDNKDQLDASNIIFTRESNKNNKLEQVATILRKIKLDKDDFLYFPDKNASIEELRSIIDYDLVVALGDRFRFTSIGTILWNAANFNKNQ